MLKPKLVRKDLLKYQNSIQTHLRSVIYCQEGVRDR